MYVLKNTDKNWVCLIATDITKIVFILITDLDYNKLSHPNATLQDKVTNNDESGIIIDETVESISEIHEDTSKNNEFPTKSNMKESDINSKETENVTEVKITEKVTTVDDSENEAVIDEKKTEEYIDLSAEVCTTTS